MSARSPIRRFEDLLAHDGVVGSQGGVADSHVYATFIKNLFKARLRVVPGYPGSVEAVIAMERGEIDGVCGWTWSSLKLQRPDWIRDHTVNIILQLSMSRNAELPNVPLVSDFANGPMQLGQVRLVFSRQTTGRPIAVAGEVPAERVAALRQAFDSTMDDTAFRQFVEKAKIDINPVPGEKVQELVASLLATPKDVIDATIHNISE
jgi:tripartite-type tricarboxylate transporter receptor subunit TctC